MRPARAFNFIFITDLELLCNVIELPDDDICGPWSVRPPSQSLSVSGTYTWKNNVALGPTLKKYIKKIHLVWLPPKRILNIHNLLAFTKLD